MGMETVVYSVCVHVYKAIRMPDKLLWVCLGGTHVMLVGIH